MKQLFILSLGAIIMLTSGCRQAMEPDVLMDTDQINGTPIEGQYIVVLKSETTEGLQKSAVTVTSLASNILATSGVDGEVTRLYAHALTGFALNVADEDAQVLLNDPRVDYIEQDRIMMLGNPGATAKPSAQQSTPWGIARVGGAGDGTGKTAWVIDTGIDLDHPDLNVDVSRSTNFVARGKDSPDDGNGHGTHVAGTIGALDNEIDVVGVAAGASLVAVRVLDNSGSGTYSGVIAGIDYVAQNGSTGDVANMSLGGPPSQALDDAVTNAAATGVAFALAAGNDGDDANNYSPARVNGANIYTISAIGSDDCMPSWSNWGNPPVDFAAPGVSILSTAKGGGTSTKSGTSMATPHVAGILVLGAVNSDGTACNDPDGNSDSIAHR